MEEYFGYVCHEIFAKSWIEPCISTSLENWSFISYYKSWLLNLFALAAIVVVTVGRPFGKINSI